MAAQPPTMRWGPTRGWGEGGVLLCRSDVNHAEAPRRAVKRHASDAGVGDDVSADTGDLGDTTVGGRRALSARTGVVGGLSGMGGASAHVPLPWNALDESGCARRQQGHGRRCKRRMYSTKLGPQLLSVCLVEQNGFPDRAVDDLESVLSQADGLDAADAAAHAVQCEAVGAVAVASVVIHWAVRRSVTRVPSDAAEWVDLCAQCLVGGHLHCAHAILSELAPLAALSPTVHALREQFDRQAGGAMEEGDGRMVDDEGGCGDGCSMALRSPHAHSSGSGAGVDSNCVNATPLSAAPEVGMDDPGVLVCLGASAVEWRAGNVETAARILEDEIGRDPHAPKLWYALGTLRRHTDGRAAALATYRNGLRACPSSGTLHRLVSSPLECTVANDDALDMDAMRVERGGLASACCP
eukprot:m.96383 g.96383  ORF g.96383 m.96383 type:complete len:411 (+) comp10162_c0_seq2:264-1496(+)